MADYITKPVSFEQLENVIKKYLWPIIKYHFLYLSNSWLIFNI
jgi:hypothetical protein